MDSCSIADTYTQYVQKATVKNPKDLREREGATVLASRLFGCHLLVLGMS